MTKTNSVHEILSKDLSKLSKVELTEMRRNGLIQQRDPKFFICRLSIPAGILTAEQLETISKLANEYGNGEVHISTRQGIQIPWVPYERLGEIQEKLKENGTPTWGCGPTIRNIIACPGYPECRNANIDTRKLAYKIKDFIDEMELGHNLKGKFKIAIAGCPNSCANVYSNDVGIVGVIRPRVNEEICNGCKVCVAICKEKAITIVNEKAIIDFEKCVYCGDCIRLCPFDAIEPEKEGFNIFLGGKQGRHPSLAKKLVEFADEDTVLSIIEGAVKVFEKEGLADGVRKERFGALVERLGFDEMRSLLCGEEDE